ncbi:hypothetical protein DAI22_06g014700 [Oryza sativa Japonica Group]|nr:hypothetical protein DAI22_06g014700 [Oryza sativa Japonica Group]
MKSKDATVCFNRNSTTPKSWLSLSRHEGSFEKDILYVYYCCSLISCNQKPYIWFLVYCNYLLLITS